MAYQTGSATGANDLLTQLAAWLVTRGWIQDASVADGSGWRVHLQKSGWYVHLKTTPGGAPPWTGYTNNGSNPPSLWVYMSTNYAGTGVNWNVAGTTGQATGSGQTYAVGHGCHVGTTAIASYHFFDDGNDHIVVVVERTPGMFQALGFGLSVTQHGGSNASCYTFGQYNGGNMYSSSPYTSGSGTGQALCPCVNSADAYDNNSATMYLKCDVDAFVGKWLGVGTTTTDTRSGNTGKTAISSAHKPSGANWTATSAPSTYIPHTDRLFGRGVNVIDSRAILLPIRIFALRDAGGYSLVATLPSVYQTNAVGNGYSALQEVQLGADTYKFFPNFAVKKVA